VNIPNNSSTEPEITPRVNVSKQFPPQGRAAPVSIPLGYIYAPTSPTNGKAVASMVLGILSIALCWLYGIVGLVLGILAIVFGVQGRRRPDGHGMATAGLVTGILGVVFSTFWVIVFVAVLATGG
jgi:hypothetical protein